MPTHLWVRLISVVATSVLVVAGGCTTDEPEEPSGDQAETASTLVTFDGEAGEYPEGVTVDDDGNVYASVSAKGRLVRIEAGSETAETFGEVEVREGDLGLLGLTVDDAGDVYGTVVSEDANANGVWRFDGEGGEAERVPGTEEITFANAVVFDEDTMYVTDTRGPDGKGAIWRVPEGGEAELWAESDLLAGDESAGFGFPLGPNGIDVHDDRVYVGLTEPASIAVIPIEDDGSAGEVSIFADLKKEGPNDGPIAVDGIEVDADGSIYVAAPLIHRIVKVSPDGESVETVATADDRLDCPASLVLADDAMYVSSFSAALGEASNGIGPAIIRVPL